MYPELEPPLRLGNTGGAVAPENFDYGCRTQQLSIHEKESWKEVSDADKAIWLSPLLKGLW